MSSPSDADGKFWAVSEVRDGHRPPFDELTVDGEGVIHFGRGVSFGAWEILRRVAGEYGPHLAYDAATCGTIIVEPETTFEAFYLALAGVPPRADGLDRQWWPSRDGGAGRSEPRPLG